MKFPYTVPSQKSRLFEKIKAEVEAQVSKELDLSDLIGVIGLSNSTITRVFVQGLGKTPVQYHREIRLIEASLLLQDPWIRVKEVSWHFGFPDIHSFSRSFKAYYGVSPSKFRKLSNPPKI